MPLFATLDRLKADLDALRPLAPEQEQRVLQKFRLDWNYHSNAIEGNSLTLGETRSLLLHGLTAEGKPLRDHLDIKGHNEAILGLEEVVHDTRPLTEQFIREMHQVLLGEEHYKSAHTASGQPTRQRIVPGQYKTSTNNVRTATGETFFFASPEETPAKMHDLLAWYRQEEATPTLHPVALAAEFHHRFVSIHPFDDGNGRMSRLLMNLILMRHGYPITVIKADELTRNRYLATLSAADVNDPEPFLRFIIENVEASLRLMIRAAKGEAINEPDDLDKKLALLKVELQGETGAPDTVWDLHSQNIFYQRFLAPWLDKLNEEAGKFDFAFVRKQFFLLTSSNRSVMNEGVDNATVLQRTAEELFTSKTLLTSADIVVRWEAFRQKGNVFDINLTIRIRFRGAEFSISAEVDQEHKNRLGASPAAILLGDKILLDSPYRSNYPPELTHDTVKVAANMVYDAISAKKAAFDKQG
ncbi:Fic family protein [Hymenobacter terrenus]|uniref:Fic family protein n=1 Tax=Hymenobacter terrenus TaxID=1629124 RepID=UPI0006973E21|nr:Fic family protein [Hymenobacter terrenus]